MFTLKQLIDEVSQTTTIGKGRELNTSCCYITLVKNVDASLPLFADFDINGTIVASDSYENIVKQYGDLDLKELGDTRMKHFKILWSNIELTGKTSSDAFNVQHMVRVVDVNDEVVSYTTLRSRWGQALVNYKMVAA